MLVNLLLPWNTWKVYAVWKLFPVSTGWMYVKLMQMRSNIVHVNCFSPTLNATMYTHQSVDELSFVCNWSIGIRCVSFRMLNFTRHKMSTEPAFLKRIKQ